MDPTWHEEERDGVRLACADFGGEGPPLLLLHGLLGYAREWDATARALVRSHRVLAPDQRGHGLSERRPADVSREAFTRDAAFWLEQLDLAPAAVAGQSLGGHTAFLLAARRPDLVERLVVAEATPEPDPEAPARVAGWLAGWPLPFRSRAQAIRFFGESAWGRAWAGGLERGDDGLRPAFAGDVMLAALAESARRSYWPEWRSIACPVLVVRGGRGIPAGLAERMLAELPGARLAEIEDAGHDLHLEQPRAWSRALRAFLRA